MKSRLCFISLDVYIENRNVDKNLFQKSAKECLENPRVSLIGAAPGSSSQARKEQGTTTTENILPNL